MMQNAALLWHVSLLVPPERKGLALGLVGLVRVVPIVVFSMISGVVADAWDRRRLMLFTQIARRRSSRSALAVLAFRGADARCGRSTCWRRSASAVGAFDLPARQALVPTLVPREHLPNAISLNTIMFQTASVVGPSLGGLLIAAAGVGWVYVANAMSFGVRDRRAADDARRAGAPAVGSRLARRRVAGTRRSKGCGSSSARRSSDRRCCSISSRRSSRRRRRCCRSSRRTSCRSARRATAGCTRRRRSARWRPARRWCRSPSGSSGAGRRCCGRSRGYGAGDGRSSASRDRSG